jgi:hypothetical protein
LPGELCIVGAYSLVLRDGTNEERWTKADALAVVVALTHDWTVPNEIYGTASDSYLVLLFDGLHHVHAARVQPLTSARSGPTE